MIVVLKYEKVFEDIFLEEPKMPSDFLDAKKSNDVKNAVANYDADKVKSLASDTFDTWTALMDVLNNDRKKISGCFYLREIK